MDQAAGDSSCQEAAAGLPWLVGDPAASGDSSSVVTPPSDDDDNDDGDYDDDEAQAAADSGDSSEQPRRQPDTDCCDRQRRPQKQQHNAAVAAARAAAAGGATCELASKAPAGSRRTGFDGLEELPGGIIQKKANSTIGDMTFFWLPKAFAERCFPRQSCKVPLQLEMAPAAAGAGVASERPAGAPADGTAKLNVSTGRSITYMSVDLSSYRGFKIIAWQAPKPNRDGSNSSRLTLLLQSPAAQQAVAQQAVATVAQQAAATATAAAAEQAAAATAAAVDSAEQATSIEPAGRLSTLTELPGGISQSRVDVMVGKGIHLPKPFAERCFPLLPCEVPLQLEMAPAAAGAGVASERPAGAPAEGTAKLHRYTYSGGQSVVIMSSPAAAGLASYRGFKIIAWQAPKPDRDGSNSSRLTAVLQSPAAQQAVAAAAERAAKLPADAAAAADDTGAGDDGSGRTWHTHEWTAAKNVASANLICPSKLVSDVFLPHHPADTDSLTLQLSVFKDGQPIDVTGGGGGGEVRFAKRKSSWTYCIPAAVFRLHMQGCSLQRMRAASPNLLQVFLVSSNGSADAAAAAEPGGGEAAGGGGGGGRQTQQPRRQPGLAAAARVEEDAACSEGMMDWDEEQQQQRDAAMAVGASDQQAAPGSRKRKQQQPLRRPEQADRGANDRLASAKEGAGVPAAAEAAASRIQCKADVLLGSNQSSIRPPKAFAGRCFPRLPCEVPLQLEMAPAAAGAGVASERPAGASVAATAKLNASTRGDGRSYTYMSQSAAGLNSYHGFKIIAWHAPKPDSDGSNSSRLTVVLQSPAAQQAVAQQAVTAAAEQAAAEAATAIAAAKQAAAATMTVAAEQAAAATGAAADSAEEVTTMGMEPVGRLSALTELPGGIIQNRVDVTVGKRITLPKPFVERCFPRLPCEVPLQLEMAPAAAAGAGVASERPAGAPAGGTAKLHQYTYSDGRPQFIMSSPAAAGLASYRGFKIIAWQAPKPDRDGSNSSRLTAVLQSPAAQQAVAAAAERAAKLPADAAAAADDTGAGDDGSGRTWHTHEWVAAKKVTTALLICPSKLVSDVFLPHHPADTDSLTLQLSVFKDGQPIDVTGGGGGDGVRFAKSGGSWSSWMTVAVFRLHMQGCSLQRMRAASPNLLQVFLVSSNGSADAAAAAEPGGGEAAGGGGGGGRQTQQPRRQPGLAAAARVEEDAACSEGMMDWDEEEQQQQRDAAMAAGASGQQAAPGSRKRKQQQQGGPSSSPSGNRACRGSAAAGTTRDTAAEPAAPPAAAVAQPAAGSSPPPSLAQLPAGYELPPVDSAAARMQQLLGLLQLLQADQALLAKFTAKLGRLQQAPVGDRQLHWFAVSYEMVRTWLQQGRLDMVLQSLEVALA